MRCRRCFEPWKAAERRQAQRKADEKAQDVAASGIADVLRGCESLHEYDLPPDALRVLLELRTNAEALQSLVPGAEARATLPWAAPLPEDQLDWESRSGGRGGRLLRFQDCVAGTGLPVEAWIMGRLLASDVGLVFEGAGGIIPDEDTLNTGLVRWADVAKIEDSGEQADSDSPVLGNVIATLTDGSVLQFHLGAKQERTWLRHVWQYCTGVSRSYGGDMSGSGGARGAAAASLVFQEASIPVGVGAASLPGPAPDLDVLAEKATRTLEAHADSLDFKLQSEPGAPVELAKLVDRNTSYPVMRARMIFDTASLSGDPMDIWGHLAEFATVALSHETRACYDDNVLEEQLVSVSRSVVVKWVGTPLNSTGNMFDYVVGQTAKTGENCVTVAWFSIPPALIPQFEAPRGRDYVRTFVHIGGFHIRKVGDTEHGLRLELTYIMHMDLEKVPFYVPKFLIVGQMLRSSWSLPRRIHSCVAMRVRPAELRSAPGLVAEPLFALPAVGGRPLRVPYYVHQVFSGRMRGEPSQASAPATTDAALAVVSPAVSGGPFLREVAVDAVLEQAARTALTELREFFEMSAGWNAEDVGPVAAAAGIEVHTRMVPGVKLAMVKARITASAPQERFGGCLRLAALEAAAVWMNAATLLCVDPEAEQEVLLRRCRTATAIWSAPVPDTSGLAKPVHFVNCRGLEAVVEQSGEVIVRRADSFLSNEVANALLKERPELHTHLRDRFHLSGLQFRAFKDGQNIKVEASMIHNFCGDVIPSLVPKSLVKAEIVVLQPGKIRRWHAMFASALVPRVLETSGGHGSPVLPISRVTVGGTSWAMDDFAKEQLRELFDR